MNRFVTILFFVMMSCCCFYIILASLYGGGPVTTIASLSGNAMIYAGVGADAARQSSTKAVVEYLPFDI